MQKKKKRSKEKVRGRARMYSKIIPVILSSIICTLSFCGCTPESGSEAEDKIQVAVGGYFDNEPLSERNKYDMKSEEWFEEIYPEVDIWYEKGKFSPETYLAKAEGNTLATVYYVPMTEAYNILKQGYAADITDEYIEKGYYEHTRDFILENISKDGRIYLIPTAIYDMGLLVNMNVYGESGLVAEDETPYQPKTWEETARLAKKIKDETGNVGFAFPTNGYVAGWMFMPIAWSYGAVFEEYENEGWVAKFNSPECAAALQYVKDLKWKYDVIQENELVSTAEYRMFVAKNKCGFSFADETGIENLIDYGMKRDNIGLLSMPAGPVRKVTLVGGGYNVINKNATPEQIKAAIDWTEYYRIPTRMKESYKERIDAQFEEYNKMGYLIGTESIALWEEGAEAEQYLRNKRKEMLNVNYNHIKQYNDKSTIELKLEEPIEAQELYRILGGVINKVLTDENADIPELLEGAANEFQTKCLDYVN